MASVFISYSRKDGTIVETLAEDLRARLAPVWLDRSLESNALYVQEIVHQLGQADHVIVLLSTHSRASRWVSFEIGAAVAQESVRNASIHVLCLGEQETPDYLSGRQVTRIDGQHYQQGLRRLCKSLGIRYDLKRKKPAGRKEVSLTVFRAGTQWMELIAGRHGLDCVLSDGGEQRSRVQWTMKPEQLWSHGPNGGFRARVPSRNVDWGTFDIGDRRSWRWSPLLFTENDAAKPKTILTERVRKLIAGIPGQPRRVLPKK